VIVISLHLRSVIFLRRDNYWLRLRVLVMIVVWAVGAPVADDQFVV
jgi:hypothetical protein